MTAGYRQKVDTWVRGLLGSYSPKLTADLSWNVASFAIGGVTGLLLNLLIARFYGAEVLGVFNQVYAMYLISSQVAVGGVHLSILKFTAQYSGDPEQVRASFSASMLLVLVLAAVVVLAIFLGSPLVERLLSSRDAAQGLLLTLPGLFLFSLNKAMLALLNGLRRMKEYAFFQTMRYLLMLTFLVVLIAFQLDARLLPLMFTTSEMVLFALQLPGGLRWLNLRWSRDLAGWLKVHLEFGMKSMVTNLLLTANSRVDVMILGMLGSDASVGVYSLASTLVDGFVQLTVVLRTVVNPILTRVFHEGGRLPLEDTIRRGRKSGSLVLVPLGILAVAAYFGLIHLVGLDPSFDQSWPVFAVLMLGLVPAAGYLPFQLIFNQVGQPGIQTLFILSLFLTTSVLVAAGAVRWDLMGAAAGVGLSFLMQVVYLKAFSRRYLAIRI